MRRRRPRSRCASCFASAASRPELDGGLLEALDQQEHVGGAAAGDRRHGIHVRARRRARRRRRRPPAARRRARAARSLTAAFATSAVIPLPIAAGVFGIARTMAALRAETRAELRDRLAGRDRQKHGVRRRGRRARRQHRRELIRLDREHDDVGARRDAPRRSSCAATPSVGCDGARRRHGIDDANAARGAAPARASRARAPAPCCRTRSTGSAVGAQRPAPFAARAAS